MKKSAVIIIIVVVVLVLAIFLLKKEEQKPPEIFLKTCKGNADCYFGKVTDVIDGDTIEIDGEVIRLALVDTPEKGETGYTSARIFVMNLCRISSFVLVDQDDLQLYDEFGRKIAVIYCDISYDGPIPVSKNINLELLRKGHAQLLLDFCDESEFAEESWARFYGYGC